MEIQDGRGHIKVSYGTLKAGDVFIVECLEGNMNVVLIKTEKANYDNEILAVALETGIMYAFDACRSVEPVKKTVLTLLD